MISVGIVAAGQRVASTGGGGSLPVAGATLHLDATALALANGAAVATWPDLSGAGNDATQATSGNRPVFVTGALNGNPVVRFTRASAHSLALPNFLSGSAGEAFAVVKSASDSSGTENGGLWRFGSSTDAGFYPFSDGQVYDGFGSTVRKTIGDPGPSLTTARVYSASSESGSWISRLNGGTLFSTTSNTVGWTTTPTIGLSNGQNFGGDIAELVFFPFVLSDAQRIALHDYFATKWGTPAYGTPASSGPPVSGYRLRYDATAMSGYADLDPVPSWRDLSGFNHDTGTTGTAPRYRSAGINSLPAIEFTGAGDFRISNGALRDLTAAELFVVIQAAEDPASTTQGGLWRFGADSLQTHFPYTDGNIYDHFGTTTRKTVGNPTPALTTAHVYNVVTQSGEWTARLDGSSIFTTATNTVGWWTAQYRIGRQDVTDWKGKIGELLVYPFALTSGERASVLAYLQAKWGTP